MSLRRYVFLTALIATALFGHGSVMAQGACPDRPIRMSVGFAPGGPTDVMARKLAAHLPGMVAGLGSVYQWATLVRSAGLKLQP